MQLVNQDYQVVPIDSIQPHPKNPRRGDVEIIGESIDKNGFFGSCIVQNGTNYILIGEHRWRAAKDAGATEIPVTRVEANEIEAQRIMLADNRTSDLAGYSDAMLKLALDQTDGDYSGTGYSEHDYNSLIQQEDYEEAANSGEHSSETPADGKVMIKVGRWHVAMTGDEYTALIRDIIQAVGDDDDDLIIGELRRRLRM